MKYLGTHIRPVRGASEHTKPLSGIGSEDVLASKRGNAAPIRRMA